MRWSDWGRKARIRRQASVWVIRMRGPDAGAWRAQYEAWCARSPEHGRQYDDALWFMQETSGARRVPLDSAAGAPHRREKSRYVKGIAMAAALAAAASAAIVLERHLADRAEPGVLLASETRSRMVDLADGSVVTLEPGSSILPHFDEHVRAIRLLNGDARFVVAHDAAHPFVVTASDRQVTAIGTVFNVGLRDGRVSVTMLEGVVEIKHSDPRSGAAPIRLVGGETLISAGDRDLVTARGKRPAAIGVSSARADEGGLADRADGGTEIAMIRTYDATPLGTVLADANSHAAKPIRLGALGLSGLHVEGRFELGDTRALAHVLAAALDLKVEDDGRSWVLTRV